MYSNVRMHATLLFRLPETQTKTHEIKCLSPKLSQILQTFTVYDCRLCSDCQLLAVNKYLTYLLQFDVVMAVTMRMVVF